MSDTCTCNACLRIVNTQRHEISIPNVFGFEMDMVVELCEGCSDLFHKFCNQYIELYELQSKILVDKKFRLSPKTLRGLK